MQDLERLMVRYYAENGEDCFIWNLFNYKKNGVFIDVGAFDGKYLSNSFSLSENGWDGICVEPLEAYFLLCQRNQPRSVCVNAACVDDDEIKSIQFASEPVGVYSRMEVREGDLEALQQSYRKYGDSIDAFEMMEVRAVTVWALAQAHLARRQVDLLSIDVEGGELKVLEGCRLSALKPRIICAEANSDQAKHDLDQYLSRHDYVYLRSMGNNHFYSAEEEIIERAKNISIRCSIERQVHPMGPRHTFPGILSGKIIDEPAQNTIRDLQGRLRSELRNSYKAIQFFKQLCGSADDNSNGGTDHPVIGVSTLTDPNSQPLDDFDNVLRSARNHFETMTRQNGLLTRRNRGLDRALQGARQNISHLSRKEAHLSRRNEELSSALRDVRNSLTIANENAAMAAAEYQQFLDTRLCIEIPRILRGMMRKCN